MARIQRLAFPSARRVETGDKSILDFILSRRQLPDRHFEGKEQCTFGMNAGALNDTI